MQTETKRKLREDLTPEQREQAERIGCVEFRSPRNPFSTGPTKPSSTFPAESSTKPARCLWTPSSGGRSRGANAAMRYNNAMRRR